MNFSVKLLLIVFFLVLNFCETFSAQENPAEPPLHIQRVSENVYVCQKQEDLFFVLEKIDPQTAEIQSNRRKRDQITDDFWYWSDFNKTQKYLVESQEYREQLGRDIGSDYHDGITSFAGMLGSVQDAGKKPWGDQCELWIAYASYVSVTGKAFDEGVSHADVEMSFSVLNDKDLPFTVHMGISRSLSAKAAGRTQHSHISADLHSFAACVMKTQDPQKEYMITVPLKGMRDIFFKTLPQGSIFIGDNEHEDRVRTASEGDRKVLLERESIRDINKEAATEYANQLLDLWAPLLETCPPKISHEYIIMPSGYKKASTFMLTGKDRSVKKIPTCSSVPGEYHSRYDWFFVNRALSPRVELPYVVIDLEALVGVQNWSVS